MWENDFYVDCGQYKLSSLIYLAAHSMAFADYAEQMSGVLTRALENTQI